MKNRGELEPRLRNEVALDGVHRFRELLGRLVPIRPRAETCPMPCFSRASSWLWFVPVVSNSANGKTEDSCIVFSSMVIWRSSASTRFVAVTEIAPATLAVRRNSVGGEIVEDSPGAGVS